ncbi:MULTISPECIES: Ger(x)C family spore germination C-terminal domain-containing protein [unclassified Bacillus (in: firmicutes)]|uniref:Ger(x)C family spore germination C-terminal domain-containing protein n=1 Tax=unclassified Bacillus (in: firmicutes) TaxID=185979 RepID=UPI0015CF178F|nr:MULTISPECIES: Ger(x)C family spore germination C-terminal domain-containing protein [unclassified Bacillus (in: firmicutes)]
MTTPYVATDNKNKLIIGGVKLFNGDKYTGISLSEEKSSLLLLLMNRLEKMSQMASNELSTVLAKQLEFVINSLLKANCDSLGIGRKLSIYYPEIWKKIDWEKEYRNVQFDIMVKVNIEKTGSVF